MRSSNVKLRTEMFDYVRRWEHSGLNQKEFCREEGINYYKFKYWKTQQAQEKIVIGQKQVDLHQDFIPVNIPCIENIISGIDITFPNGVKLICNQGLQPDQIKELIKLF